MAVTSDSNRILIGLVSPGSSCAILLSPLLRDFGLLQSKFSSSMNFAYLFDDPLGNIPTFPFSSVIASMTNPCFSRHVVAMALDQISYFIAK